MKRGDHVVVAAAARLYAPLIVLFAFSVLATRAPGDGVGFLAGLAFALAHALHALVAGAAAARRALPPMAARLALAGGVAAALLGAGAPAWRYAAQIIEAGVFLTTAAAAALIVSTLFGRLPTLRDAEW
jgi:multisubunit Na+/H+ antiporter MnhB subunit